MENALFLELDYLERSLNIDSEEILWNVYRTLKINEALQGRCPNDPYEVADVIKKIGAPYFKCDEKSFFEIYKRLSILTRRELLEYVTRNLMRDRFHAVVPRCLFALLFRKTGGAESILVTDCDKFGVELYDFVKSNGDKKFYLTVKSSVLNEVFRFLYNDPNVEFISPEIYTDAFTTKKFDLIVSIPVMGGRVLEANGDFISREPSFIAVQNLLYHLTAYGKLQIVLPAKIGFGGGDAETLRSYISENYKINEIASLPAKIFYPYTGISTYLLSISQGETDEVNIAKYCLKKSDGDEILAIEDSRLLFSDELAEMNNWNVDMTLSLTDETILRYKDAIVKKARLRDVADVFRGKSIVAKSDDGNVSVVNISNISELGIDYENLDAVIDEERKIGRYLLEDGDVLIATKGFAIKVAVFEKQPRMVIASSNLCVIRPNPRLINGTYLKLFLESDVGMKLIKSLQRGTTVVNVNHQDICELEVPVPPMEEQLEIVREYNAGLSLYKKTVAAAEEAWSSIKKSVKEKLF